MIEQKKIQNSRNEPPVLELAVVSRRPGRKRKLTPAVFEKIMGRIEDGDRLQDACSPFGISQKTLLALTNGDPQAAKRYASAKAMRLQHWHEQWLGEMCDHSKRSPWATGFLLARNFPHLYLDKAFIRPEPIVNNTDAIVKEVVLTLPLDEFNEIKAMSDTKMISDTELETVEHGVRMTVYLLEQH